MIDILDKKIVTGAVPFDKLEESLRIAHEIIDNLDEQGVKQLLGGAGGDLDKLMQNLVTETFVTVYGNFQSSLNPALSYDPVSNLYLDKLTDSFEETLRVESLTYFITSVMPEFEMNWHHIEWAELVQAYQNICVLAARDHGKCTSPETPIKMYSGEIKLAKDIVVGDLLMGMDGTPRTAVDVNYGKDNMFLIKQTNADSYVVNSRHTLTLMDTRFSFPEIVDISLEDFRTMSENRRDEFRGFTVDTSVVGKVNPNKFSHITVEPSHYGDYVCITVDKDHRILLGDNTVTHNSHFFSNATSAWRLYRYNKNSTRKELSTRGREGYLFSFSKSQSTKLLRTLKTTIEENDILRDKLLPVSKSDGNWAETRIVCKNGSTITSSSAGASTRGAHPHFITVDDFLHESNLYSVEQREKYISYFYSVIMNMIVPKGNVNVVGTPFHSEDLYSRLRKDKSFHYREYPSIFPNGELLWRNRYDFPTLYGKKESQGSITFSREHLVQPVTSGSSLFPYNILEKSTVGMSHYKMCHNIESFPINFQSVVIGVDLAISAAIDADATCFTILGVTENEEYYVLNQIHMRGKSYVEQLTRLKALNIEFRPDVIFIEGNGFQTMFAQASEREGMPVFSEATTSKSKNDIKTGVPGLALLFERGKFKIPTGDEYSRNIKDSMFGELSSMSYTAHGIAGVGSHDDRVMSIVMAVKGAHKTISGFGIIL